MKLKKPIYKKVQKEERIHTCEYRCLCLWSKDDKYGFVSNTICPAHGKKTYKLLKKTRKCIVSPCY